MSVRNLSENKAMPRRRRGLAKARRGAQVPIEPLEARVLLSVSLVKDINTVGNGSNPSQFVGLKGTAMAVFTATDYLNGTELWGSNGTAAGTQLIKDINPGAASSGSQDLVSIGGGVYFTANDGTDGWSLWKTDGTTAGTAQIMSFPSALATGSSTQPISPIGNITGAGGEVFFTLKPDAAHQNELWVTDGTAAGTHQLTDGISANTGNNPTNLTSLNGTLYFLSESSQKVETLFTSDGTAAGTYAIAQMPDNGAYAIYATPSMKAINGRLFILQDTLWTSDGTAAGTVQLTGSGVSLVKGDYALAVAGLGGAAYFFAYDSTNLSQLWKTDGTAAGTQRVTGFSGGLDIAFNNPVAVTANRFYFQAVSGLSSPQIWETDGTATGTNPLTTSGGQALFGGSLAGAGDNLFFEGGISANLSPVQIWKSDGTASGTAPVFSGLYSPTGLTPIGNSIFYSADDGQSGQELWKTDITTGNTGLVKQLNPADGSSILTSGVDLNGKFVLEGLSYPGIWASDGSAFSALADLIPDGQLITSNGEAYFDVSPRSQMYGLWKTDGTIDGPNWSWPLGYGRSLASTGSCMH